MKYQRWYWQLFHYLFGITALFIGFFLVLQGISAFSSFGKVQIPYLIPGVCVMVFGIICEVIYSRITIRSVKEKKDTVSWDEARKS